MLKLVFTGGFQYHKNTGLRTSKNHLPFKLLGILTDRKNIWRRRRDSNPRYGINRTHAFQACTFDRSVTSPYYYLPVILQILGAAQDKPDQVSEQPMLYQMSLMIYSSVNLIPIAELDAVALSCTDQWSSMSTKRPCPAWMRVNAAGSQERSVLSVSDTFPQTI